MIYDKKAKKLGEIIFYFRKKICELFFAECIVYNNFSVEWDCLRFTHEGLAVDNFIMGKLSSVKLTTQ